MENLKPGKVVAIEVPISGRSLSYSSKCTETETQADSRSSSDNPESTDEAPAPIVAGSRGRRRRSAEKRMGKRCIMLHSTLHHFKELSVQRSCEDLAGSQPQRAQKLQSTGGSCCEKHGC